MDRCSVVLSTRCEMLTKQLKCYLSKIVLILKLPLDPRWTALSGPKRAGGSVSTEIMSQMSCMYTGICTLRYMHFTLVYPLVYWYMAVLIYTLTLFLGPQ